MALTPINGSGRHLTVCSPLLETQERIRAWRKRQTLTVDCELYHLVRLLHEHPGKAVMYALINVTDFPLGDELERQTHAAGGTISIENDESQYPRVQEALRLLVNMVSQ